MNGLNEMNELNEMNDMDELLNSIIISEEANQTDQIKRNKNKNKNETKMNVWNEMIGFQETMKLQVDLNSFQFHFNEELIENLTRFLVVSNELNEIHYNKEKESNLNEINSNELNETNSKELNEINSNELNQINSKELNQINSNQNSFISTLLPYKMGKLHFIFYFFFQFYFSTHFICFNYNIPSNFH